MQPLGLYRNEAKFVVYVKTVTRDHSNGTLKIVRIFLDRGSVTKRKYLPS